MPNIKSAKKRVKVTDTKTLRNRMLKTACKTAIKKFEKTLEGGDKAASAEAYKNVAAVLDKAVARGILHSNTAARRKSSFAKKVNAL